MVPGTRLVIFGKQGAGKGTQCVRLARHYVVPHISTGDMFRAAVRSGSDIGKRAKEYMDAGELLPDEVVIAVVQETLKQGAALRGFILDGFPRTVEQAEALDHIVEPRGIDLAVDLDIPTEEAMRRLAVRRVCSTCGANYSTDKPPRYGWICDNCGGEVVQRDDDTVGAIRRRLEIYEKATAPLIDYYEKQGRLAVIDGTGTPDEVTGRLVDTIDTHREREIQH